MATAASRRSIWADISRVRLYRLPHAHSLLTPPTLNFRVAEIGFASYIMLIEASAHDSPPSLERLLPRGLGHRVPRRRQGRRALPGVQGGAGRAAEHGGAGQGTLPDPRQQDRPPGRRERGGAAAPARPMADDGQGQGAARGHPAHRGLHVQRGHAARFVRRLVMLPGLR